jgi:hypothetical protein
MGNGIYGAVTGEGEQSLPLTVWDGRRTLGVDQRPAYELGSVVIERELMEGESWLWNQTMARPVEFGTAWQSGFAFGRSFSGSLGK